MALPAQDVNRILARLAARRRGIVSREELLAAEISAHQIAARVRALALVPIFAGVYAIGPLAALPPLARESAALVACRPRALLARATSAQLWKRPVEAPTEIEVLVTGRTRRSLPGVRVMSINRLAPGELRRVDGIPVTSPALAILDLAADLTRDELMAATHEARVNDAKLTDHQLRSTLRGIRLAAALAS